MKFVVNIGGIYMKEYFMYIIIKIKSKYIKYDNIVHNSIAI